MLALHQHIDKTRHYFTFSNPKGPVETLKCCLKELMEWMRVKKLMRNPNKMEVLLAGCNASLGSCIKTGTRWGCKGSYLQFGDPSASDYKLISIATASLFDKKDLQQLHMPGSYLGLSTVAHSTWGYHEDIMEILTGLKCSRMWIDKI